MYRDSTDGLLYEECPRCHRRAEVDGREDARQWGVNHWAAFHAEQGAAS